MLDSGLSEAMVTPALAKRLQLRSRGAAAGQAAGGTATVPLVDLPSPALACGARLPPLEAAVASFPQESADRELPLSGMLGYQALQGYDADLDFPQGTLRLWAPGDGA
ncbi:unnamed protein product, partial [Prorocentrum cordatum]